MAKKLSIIMPIYNESVYLKRSLENIVNVHVPGWKKEIIAVNDGSTDNTLELLKNFDKNNTKIKIISSDKNMGKGAALKKGIKEASGDVLIVQDADLEYDPSDYQTILAQFEKENVNVVYGSRILGVKIYHGYNAGALYYLGGITLTKIINLMFGTGITDQPTCYKSWRSNLSSDLVKCRSNGFEFEVEMTALFSMKNKIAEVPIRYYPRTVGQGKKITFRDFVKSVLTAFRCKFNAQ